MNRLAAFFYRLSPRRRFLLAPLLSLGLLGVLTAAFLAESQRQNALLSHVADEDLVAFNRYFDIYADLSAQHTTLYALLLSAKKLDEQTLYNRGKERVDAIYDSVRKLEQASPAPGPLLARSRDYLRTATAAVEMATVNLDLASAQLVRANEQFAALSQAFNQTLGEQRSRIHHDIVSQVKRSRASGLLIAVIGVSSALLLLALSLYLSRLLSRREP